ncbi:MAG: amidohydrolase, partial [Aquirufa sp.]
MKITLLRWMAMILFFISSPLLGQTTFPINDVADPRQGYYAFTNANIIKDSKNTISHGTLIIRKGKIEQIGVNIPLPKEAVVIDCKGKYIYPSFIDLYTDYGAPSIQANNRSYSGSSQMLSNTKGAFGWNQALKSEFSMGKNFTVNDSKAKELRNIGFGTVLTHQMDGISRGTGSLVTLAKEKENLVVLREKAAAHYSFSKGSSTQDYPNSLMGSIALMRQLFQDAKWYKNKSEGEGLNLTLQSFNEQLSLPQIFEVADKWSALRADKVGDEFGIQYIIKASGEEYQRIDEMKATQASFILPIAFPQAMDLEDPTDARFVNLSELKHWELAPSNPASFEKANITFALSTNGLKDLSQFLPNVRKAIQRGLSEQKALEALTQTPATLIGANDLVGTLETGKLANFFISNGPIFDEKSSIIENWIQGNGYSIHSDLNSNLAGKYKLSLGSENFTLQVSGSSGSYKASLIAKDTIQADLSQKGQLVNLSFSAKINNGKKTRLTGTQQTDSWIGTGQEPSGNWISWSALKENPAKSDSSKVMPKEKEILGDVVYPFVGFGQKNIAKSGTYLIKNTTVWTNEKQGILNETDVLIKGGKIAEIGKNLQDKTAKIIDGKNKHLTAGIIDEHSHVAATGGINECSQSVTAEVRVADVIEPDDIDIYRQLSGGVTSSHILHGSCNTIGGQT